MNINQKDLVLISFPFSDYRSAKMRPALVVSNKEINRTDDCIMVPLTSTMKNEKFSITINQKNLSSGHLIKTSRVKIDKIFSLEQKLIKMKIGELEKSHFEKTKLLGCFEFFEDVWHGS